LQPILFLLAPLYWVVSSPLTLVVCQTVFLAFGGILIYWLARTVLKDRLLAFLLLVLYLLYPPLKEMNLFDFHPEALNVPLLLGAFCFLHRDRLLPFLLLLVLAILTKEEMPGIVMIFGVYLLLVKRRPLWGTGLVLAGVTLFFLELRILMPYFSGGGVAYAVFDRYAHLGGGISGILHTLFTDPGRIFALLAAHLPYTRTIFLPLGFLPLLSPTHLLLTSPNLVANLLTEHDPQYRLTLHYVATALPFLFVAAVFGLKNLLGAARFLGLRQATISRAGAMGLLVLIIWATQTSPVTEDLRRFWQPERAAAGRGLVQQIPAEASVLASHKLVPHLSERQHIYYYGCPPPQELDYIALDNLTWQAIAAPCWTASREWYEAAVSLLKEDGKYEEIYSAGDFRLFRRQLGLPPVGFSDWPLLVRGVPPDETPVQERAYHAFISSPQLRYRALAGRKLHIPIGVRNAGSLVWRSEGDQPFFLSYHLYARTGELLVFDNERTPLPGQVSPGGGAALLLEVTAPQQLANYVVEIDLVHEYVTWFAPQASEVLRVTLEVEDKRQM
jgi:uncharacterized membrane protein